MRILIVSAQFPYPPHSGFAMRVYQLARQLAARHQVTILSYLPPDQRAGLDRLSEELRVRVVERDQPTLGRKRAEQALSMGSPRPFSCRAVHSPSMQQAIDDLCASDAFDVIQLESSLLCTFSFPQQTRIILDEHNIEYEVFRRMCESERSTLRRTFNRLEHARFRRFEQSWWRRVDGCVVTSEREAPVVAAHAPETPVAVVPNGVDLQYFRPAPSEPEAQTLVFNGILTYRPNLDAAHHLVEEVWPLVLRERPDARLTLVGRAEPADLRRLRRPGVVLTGEVPDIRPYLERAAVVGVPIRMGGGTRLKVVEGLAMGKAMVSTTLGCEGIAVRDGEHLLIGDDAPSFAARVVQLFGDPAGAAALGRAGRGLIEREYSWDLAGARLEALYRRVIEEGRTVRGTPALRPPGVGAADSEADGKRLATAPARTRA